MPRFYRKVVRGPLMDRTRPKAPNGEQAETGASTHTPPGQTPLQLDAVFRSITDPIILTDPDNIILTCNPAFYLQFGYEEDDVEGHPTSMLLARAVGSVRAMTLPASERWYRKKN